ncbi:hypothetical protein XH92_28625 [Bradyrhizobium sp. CCBAU 53421]|nr:hypothetical protein XH92_28625 [Bradyrhizobium sp. CCBAU 53421]
MLVLAALVLTNTPLFCAEVASIRLAAEIARITDDGDKLHAWAVVTLGSTEKLNSPLRLRGIEATHPLPPSRWHRAIVSVEPE